MPAPPLKLVVVGCGAITARAHLPAAADIEELEVIALVDRDLGRAEELADRFGIRRVADDWARLPERPDAALVALPNHLHAPASLELLRRGVHVLVEKPMALTAADCDEMIQAARRTGARLAVGMVRRFLPEVRTARAVLDSGCLGALVECRVKEGRVYDWPTRTEAAFRRQTAGGGVLVDNGVHALDTLLYWLGEVESLDYRDDAYGGVEADCEIDLRFASGVLGWVELSRTRKLGETARIRGARASLKVDLLQGTVRLHGGAGGSAVEEVEVPEPGLDIFRAQLSDFARAVREGREPAVPGAEGRRSVALVEACYARRKPLALPWVAPDSTAEASRCP